MARSAWDTLRLAGDPAPGLCVSITGATNARAWDTKKATNSSGASIVYSGDELAKLKVRLLLWTDAHLAEWEAWKRHLAPPTEGNPNALDIEHPALALLTVPITSVVVEDAGGPVLQPDGTYTIDIALLQYRAPTPATAVPGGSKSSGAGTGTTGGDSDANAAPDAVDRYITELTDDVGSLASG
jgi:hypothetical protein